MVNITARQWILKPLLQLRHGKGALILPPPPAPQLTSISLSYPKNRKSKPGTKTDGLAMLQKRYLPRLKYYNPSIKIDVDHPSEMSSNCLITLQFEGTDPGALRAIAQKSARQDQMRQELKRTPDGESPDPQTEEQKPTTEQPRLTADSDEIVLKSQPSANPSAPSTVKPPLPIYTRSVTLAAAHRPHWDVWKWLRKRTGGTIPPLSEEDRKLYFEIKDHNRQARVDRERVKVVTAQIKEEEAALAKAKKAVDEAAAGTA